MSKHFVLIDREGPFVSSIVFAVEVPVADCADYESALAAERLLQLPDGPTRAEILSRPSLVFGGMP